ncbi:triose-phosphate isomerase [Acetobacterium woodii]|uniref:Triosephosphate isomerase n=1 Tax=Acetobacterium woodii (strain ATCC 29683 / DSM 1030 / JCM 2381 / KCTC 1655 / WB1) TaxID=931626 RepID=H6LBU5_ACEWD|nr:triose-phosphate isomerase [Acetobacterium woodii]AFA47688.1 triosephosphate isomerase TpiA1 [Acetobacterium woodii DSM 1030]
MKKFLLGTNWKMNKTLADATQYTNDLMPIIEKYPAFDFFIIPSYTHLWKLKELIDTNKSALKLGAQNMHYADSGQFTGEISPVMLKEIGLDIIELGHCERRQYFNETDETVNLKTLAALKHGFIPLICIGEKSEDKNYGVSKEMLAKQLKIALKDVPSDKIGQFWVAYEPVWAIGVNGIPAETPYVKKIHDFLRTVLIELYGPLGKDVPLLFGGSVNINNAKDYAGLENVDGLFIGRSAWEPDLFEEIMVSVGDTLK